MAGQLPAGNELLGCFLCQGKMPDSVRAKYELLAQTAPEQAKPLLINFDRARIHPDEEDLERLSAEVRTLLKTVSCSERCDE